LAVSSPAWTVRPPLLVVVAAIDYTMASWLTSGRPRQFPEMAEQPVLEAPPARPAQWHRRQR
jgi:hypothetical protein